jgi:hypothetical protein
MPVRGPDAPTVSALDCARYLCLLMQANGSSGSAGGSPRAGDAVASGVISSSGPVGGSTGATGSSAHSHGRSGEAVHNDPLRQAQVQRRERMQALDLEKLKSKASSGALEAEALEALTVKMGMWVAPAQQAGCPAPPRARCSHVA